MALPDVTSASFAFIYRTTFMVGPEPRGINVFRTQLLFKGTTLNPPQSSPHSIENGTILPKRHCNIYMFTSVCQIM